MAFFAPGDASMMSSSTSSNTPAPTPQQQQQQQSLWQYMTDRRSRKQASMVFLGATFLTLSSILSRRATLWRQRAMYPTFYKPSNAAPPPIDGRLEALQALQFGSMTAVSGVVMLGGGLLWAFDISSTDDLKAKFAQKRIARVPIKSERQLEAEFDQWLAAELAKREPRKGGTQLSGERDGSGRA